ncbi:MAG: VCBS repeat-containing protein [Proteobacteria bacterium]|nr:VCBS repeat-containing protein [Pseudomonadota bacterium]
MKRDAVTVMALVCAAMGSPTARADERAGGESGSSTSERQRALKALWRNAVELLEAASDANEPPLVPPQPIAVRWRARRISSIDLGAPLLALDSADIDGNGRAELLFLTSRDVFVIEHRGRRSLTVRSRASLPPPPATIGPRDSVGAMVVSDFDGDGRLEIAAQSSQQVRGAVFAYRDGNLAELDLELAGETDRKAGSAAEQGSDRPDRRPSDAAGQGSATALAVAARAARAGKFPLCVGLAGQLEPGRNYFTAFEHSPIFGPWAGETVEVPIPARFFSIRCRDNLLDSAGRALTIAGVVSTDGTLSLWARRQCRRHDSECHSAPTTASTVSDVGVVFEIADIDRDGHAEIAVTAATPPGAPDQVDVLSWKDGRLDRLFRRSFSGGVVGLTAGDIDGDDALEVIAAIRLSGSTRIDLWTIN